MNPSKPQSDLLWSTQQANLFMSGQGGGKTFCAGVISAQFAWSFPQVRGLIGANTYDQLNKSTLFRVREVWKEHFNWVEYNEYTGRGQYVVGVKPPRGFNTEWHNYDRYSNILSFKNGAVIYIGSLDRYKALDGMEIGWAILDETKDTREEAVTEVITGRLRQEGMYVGDTGWILDEKMQPYKSGEPFNPLYILTSPAKVAWLNNWFGLIDHEQEILSKIFSDTTYFSKDTTENKKVVISSTYHNLDNLPKNYIENRKSNVPSHLHEMLIYGSPFSKTGGEFYKCFDLESHVLDEIEYDANMPLHISFDENVNPYMTCTIWQIDGKDAYQIDEICLPSPNNRVTKVCAEFIRRYMGHVAGLFIYGDRTSKKEDAKLEKGQNMFTIIANELHEFRPVLRLPSKNPPVVMRGNFKNAIFENEFAGIRVRIAKKCRNSIADYTYVKEDSDGSKKKETAKDELTGVTYEQFGHTSDANDYLICEAFNIEFRKYQAPKGEAERIIGQPVANGSTY